MSGEVIYNSAKRGFICKTLAVVFIVVRSGSPPEMQLAQRARLLNMCVIVFFPRFRGVKGNAGVSQGEAIEASVTAAIQSPGAQQIPGPALVGGEGPGLGLGATGVPKAFSSHSSHQHKRGPGPCWEVCLEKAEPRLGRMG